MNERDLFICPLRVASGMRNKVLQAMAAEMTVISSTMGVEGLSVEAGRHFLAADDEEAWVTQIGAALGSPELRAELGSQARQYVIEHHSGEVAGRQLLDLYKKLI